MNIYSESILYKSSNNFKKLKNGPDELSKLQNKLANIKKLRADRSLKMISSTKNSKSKISKRSMINKDELKIGDTKERSSSSNKLVPKFS